MAWPEVENVTGVRAVGAGPEQQQNPRQRAAAEVSVDHRAQRPLLQVRPLDRRVEDAATAAPCKAHAELHVLNRRVREAILVEAPARRERMPSDCAKPG